MFNTRYRWNSLFLILLLAAATQTCWAHAVLMDSTPKLNSTVQGRTWILRCATTCGLMAADRA